MFRGGGRWLKVCFAQGGISSTKMVWVLVGGHRGSLVKPIFKETDAYWKLWLKIHDQ